MIFNIIFKILYTILGLWVITLYAGLTAILTPNFMLFELSYEYIKLLVFWLASIGGRILFFDTDEKSNY